MGRTLTIHADDLLAEALSERARTRGTTAPEVALEILSRALLAPTRQAARHDPEGGSKARSSSRPPAAASREVEHAWRRSHSELLQDRYAGDWLVVEGEEIVAHGRDAIEVVREARSKGVAVPYLFFVESCRQAGVVRMGL